MALLRVVLPQTAMQQAPSMQAAMQPLAMQMTAIHNRDNRDF